MKTQKPKKITAEEQQKMFRDCMKEDRHGPNSMRDPKYEISHKVETLLLDMECSFPDKGRIRAIPFIVGGWPYHLSKYTDNSNSNVHVFYQFDNHPEKCLYLRGFVKESTDSEAHILASVILSAKRYAIRDDIDSQWSFYSGCGYGAIENAMKKLEKCAPLPGFAKEGVKVPYDPEVLEEMIYKSLPKKLIQRIRGTK